MNIKMWILGIGVIVATAIVVGGCGGSKVARVDVAAGEYYSEDDYESISGGRKNEYCQEMEAEVSRSQTQFEEQSTEVQRMKDLIESMRKQIIPIERETLQLEADIRTLNNQIDEVKSLPQVYKIKPGDTLTLIAMNEKIYDDIDKWWRIFEANRDKIDDPYYIFPDTTLVIPRDWPTD